MNSSTSATLVLPLLPTLSYRDILIPPFLILVALLLFTLYEAPPAKVLGHIYHATTQHARFLPTPAKHVFSYPVLFFGFDLDSLERNQLDLGRWFAFRPARWCLTSIDPEVYFEPSKEDKRGIRSKLDGHLEARGIGQDRRKSVYTVTMPSLAGWTEINPLTVHFTYSEERRLEVVVLEVSNTFGEKHLYVLEVGKNEDVEVAKGYTHQWTFPRAFHVSPFNDRTGHYRVSLSDPLALPASSPPTDSSLPVNPRINVKVLFLTPEFEKKLFATLVGPSVPLHRGSILSSLFRYPFSLFLTTPRILYQAALLHYGKHLDVFPRPEPHSGLQEDDPGNPVQSGGEVGNVQWQEPDQLSLLVKDVIYDFITRRLESGADNLPSSVILMPANPSSPTLTFTAPPSSPSNTNPALTITYLTPTFFSDLLLSPTPSLALDLATKVTRRWSVSSPQLFHSLFTPPPSNTSPPLATRALSHIRQSNCTWSTSFASSPSSLPPLSSSPHPLDTPAPSWKLVYQAFLASLLVRVGYWVFVATRARFVRGTEPWTEWARLSEMKEGEEGKGRRDVGEFGSVLRSA